MHGLIHRRRRNLPDVFEGRRSRMYDFVSRRVLRGFYRRVAADVAAAAPDGAAVLDVGTGPGVLLVELATRRPDLRLTGIDLSADMVTAAVRNLAPFGERATACVGDVTRLPFPDRSFDLIVSSLSLHHWDHPEDAVPELARTLRPGGRVHIYDFPFAPFDKLADTAWDRSVLNGHSRDRTSIRTGIPFLRCVRYVMSS
jgi:ubiquinone/menaquinone biosynthesis C-methylase UbiE